MGVGGEEKNQPKIFFWNVEIILFFLNENNILYFKSDLAALFLLFFPSNVVSFISPCTPF